MKIKVFQIIWNVFDNKGNIIPKEQRTFKIDCIGTVIVPKNKKDFIEDSVWDLFNWTCWWYDKHLNTYLKGLRKGFRRQGYRCFPNSNARGYCNSDICFFNGDKWCVAKSVGWEYFDNKEDAFEFLKDKSQRF